MSLQVSDLCLVGVQPEPHVIRHAIQVQGTVTIGKNLLDPVITGNYDEMIVGVKDVINGRFWLVAVHLLLDQLHVNLMRGHQLAIVNNESLGGGLGSRQIHIGTHRLDGGNG